MPEVGELRRGLRSGETSGSDLCVRLEEAVKGREP